jgi:hypothetical protein
VKGVLAQTPDPHPDGVWEEPLTATCAKTLGMGSVLRPSPCPLRYACQIKRCCVQKQRKQLLAVPAAGSCQLYCRWQPSPERDVAASLLQDRFWAGIGIGLLALQIRCACKRMLPFNGCPLAFS